MVQRFDVGARLSEMAIHNGVVYLAGQIPEDPNLDIEGQTLQVLEAMCAAAWFPSHDKNFFDLFIM
jgi:enamine deaminase RidA (YjgF/YER057c/UK114 family)